MSMKREGTMQKTAREAKEFGYGCDCDDEEHDHGDGEVEETNGDAPSAKRQSTMQITAQEGIDYLKTQGKDALLKAQGLAPPGGDDNDDDDEDEDDDGDDDNDDSADNDENGEKNGEKPRVKKSRTMAATAAEGEILLDYMGGKPDPEARTRAQQKELEEAGEDDLPDEPEAKKPRRTQTMQAATEEAKEIVDDGLGGTRSETAAVKKAEQEKVSPKRASTIQKTVEEGAEFLQGGK